MKVSRWLPVMLGFLSAIGPLSTDMYLPAFPAIEASLGGRPGTAQITLAAWFAGLAVGQITQGSLSDRFGRRVPLIAAMVLYSVASVGCALAPDLLTLSICRAVAAIGGSASMVVPRAVVRDLVDGHAAARLMAQLILVMGVAPILAPTLGGAVLGAAGWHAIFWITAAYGAFGALLVWRFLPDTLPVRMRVRLGPGAMLARFVLIARERSFITHALVGGFAMGGMFAYIGGSPVLITIYGIKPENFGILFGMCAAGFIAGSQISPRLLPRLGASRVLTAGVRAYLLAAALLNIAVFGGVFGLVGIFGAVFLALSSMGFVMPNAAVGAMSRHPAHAGSASALMGTLQFSLAAASGLLVASLADGTPRPFALLMLLGASCATIADLRRPRA